MAPIRVWAGALDIDYKVDRLTDRLMSAEVGWVGTDLKASGLRIGDKLISVDGAAISGMLRSDYISSAERNRGVLIFMRPRSLFHRQVNLTLKITPKAAIAPNPESSGSAQPDTGHLLNKPVAKGEHR